MIHTLGHISNLEAFVVGQTLTSGTAGGSDTDANAEHEGLLSTLSSISGSGYINPVRQPYAVPIVDTLKLVPGATGLVLCLVLGLFASTSNEYVRRSFYNLFWYAHQSFATVFMALYCVHSLQGVVRKQTNLSAHDPQQCYVRYAEWPTEDRACDMPAFAGSTPTSWMWVLPSICVYMLERLTRLVRGLRRHDLDEHKMHPSNVIELRIANNVPRTRIKYRSGQYVYLNVRELSLFEWHPFTITSAPSDSKLTVHVRNAGDWTARLIERKDQLKSVSIDGPYGTCAEDVFKYERLILIGAGIGVTPYASILKHIAHKLVDVKGAKFKRIHFFWICSSIDTFEWFGHLLKKLERKMPHVLDYRIHLTRGWSHKQAHQIVSNDADDHDLFTGLQTKTNYGRPNFDLFFREVVANAAANQQQHQQQQQQEQSEQTTKSSGASKEDYGVFFCGPPQLSSELHMLCNKYSSKSVRFFYNKENF